MFDTPPRQVQRILDDGAADMATLVDLGFLEEQPRPQGPPETVPPVVPDPPPGLAR